MKPIVSENSRIRHRDHFEIGPYSIVDDYCYFSTRVKIGICSHIASGCSVAGGKERLFTIGNFSSLSSGVKIWCTSDDFTNDLVTLIPPGMESPKKKLMSSDVSFANYTAVGSNSVVLPGNHVPEGTVIGALSFVPQHFEFKAWSVYAGNPIRYVKPRNKEEVLEQAKEIEAFIQGFRKAA